MKNILIIILTISVLLSGCTSKTEKRDSSIDNKKVSEANVDSSKDEDTKDKTNKAEMGKNDIVIGKNNIEKNNIEKNNIESGKDNIQTDKAIDKNADEASNNEMLTNDKEDIVTKKDIARTKDISVRSQYKSLEDIPDNFTYADAQNSAILVLSGRKIITGQDIWNEFLNKVHKGEEASVLIVKYYDITNQKQYNKNVTKQRKDYELIKYIYQLDYDGKSYKLSHYKENKRFAYSYPYMIEKIGMLPNAAIASHGFYLVFNEKLTYHDLQWSSLSSNSSDQINFQPIFEEKVEKALYLSCKPGIYQTKDENTSMYLDENCRFLFIKNKVTKNLPVGRYYFEDNKLILVTGNEDQYVFAITGKGRLNYINNKNADRLVGEETEFILKRR